MKPYVPDQLPIEGLDFKHLSGLAQTSSGELPFAQTMNDDRMTGLAYRASDANTLVYCKSDSAIHNRVWVSQTIHKHSCVSRNAFFHPQAVGRFAGRRAVARRHLLAETETRWTSIAYNRALLFTRISLAVLAAAAAGRRTAVLSYDETEHTRERVDIAKLNAELATTVARIDQLRTEIEVIVAEIEGKEVEA